MRSVQPPPGFAELVSSRTKSVVAFERVALAVAEILGTSTLYEWAAAHPERTEMRGRGPVYAAPLPNGGPRVVVRHAFRGGLLAPLLRDLYLPPTAAPSELFISWLLARAGVPTPPVLAYATYGVAGIFRRVDVVSLELRGTTLVDELRSAPTAEAQAPLRQALANLLHALTEAGAWHQDLNARNILLVKSSTDVPTAVVLDVDRVRFVPAGEPSILEANISRLRRSLSKLATAGEFVFHDSDFREIRELVRVHAATSAADREAALQPYML